MALLFFTACLLTRAVAAGNPSNASIFQLDVVYPYPGGVFRRTAMFPIIFAMSGLESIWQDRPGLEWTLRGLRSGNGSQPEDWGTEKAGDWGSFDAGTNFSSSAAANALFVAGDLEPTSHKYTQWQLEYSFYRFDYMNSSCLPKQLPQGGNTTFRDAPIPPHITGSFNFTIDDQVPPRAFTAGTCGHPLGALEFVGRDESTNSCVVMAPSSPALQECRSRLQNDDLEKIRKAFSSGIDCGAVNTSAPEFGATLCRRPASKASVLEPVMYQTLMFTMAAISVCAFFV